MQFARVVTTVELADASTPGFGPGVQPPPGRALSAGGLTRIVVATTVSLSHEAVEERRVL